MLGQVLPESELQGGQSRGKVPELELCSYPWDVKGADFFSSYLAGDPDIAGAYELCSWSVSLLRALD